MTVLSRHLLRQNLWLMGLCLALGAGIYLLFDLFDRLDDFLAAKAGLAVILAYYAAKMPLILAQILPAVFVLALLIQLSLMASSRELIALRAGGVGPGVLLRIFLIYSVVWSAGQLALTELAGPPGLAYTQRVWAERVQGRAPGRREIVNVWFRQGRVIGRVDAADLAAGEGRGLALYELAADQAGLVRVIRARRFSVLPDNAGLRLAKARVDDLAARRSEEVASLDYPLDLNLRAFAAQGADLPPGQQPLLELVARIRQLRAMGSNVEGLQTAMYAKVSYAGSIVALALAAMAIASLGAGIAVNVVAGLAATFAFYTLHSLGSAAGEQGVLPPILGAFLGNLLVAAAALGRLLWPQRL